MDLKGHKGGVDQLCWNPSKDTALATASSDKTIRIWDVRSGLCASANWGLNFAGKTSSVIDTESECINIAWNADGNYIAASNRVRP